MYLLTAMVPLQKITWADTEGTRINFAPYMHWSHLLTCTYRLAPFLPQLATCSSNLQTCQVLRFKLSEIADGGTTLCFAGNGTVGGPCRIWEMPFLHSDK